MAVSGRLAVLLVRRLVQQVLELRRVQHLDLGDPAWRGTGGEGRKGEGTRTGKERVGTSGAGMLGEA